MGREVELMTVLDWLYITVTWPVLVAAVVLNVRAFRRPK